MTKLIVDPGACGFTCTVEVDKVGKYQATINIQSHCKQIKKLADAITEIDFMEICRQPFGQNYITQSAARCSLHPSCPIPCALIKAIEGELGMAVKKNIGFTYEE
jgi:Family of unknown function (DUF6951)